MKAACLVCMPIETYRDLETWQACMDDAVQRSRRLGTSVDSCLYQSCTSPTTSSVVIWCQSLAQVSY